MKVVSNRKWQTTSEIANQIKNWLIEHGGIEDAKLGNEYESWRIKYSDATFSFYKKGTLFVTDSNDGALLEAHGFIDSLLGSKFILPSRDFLIGFDETGKGEVFGHVILVGALIPKELFSDLEEVIGVADTKNSHSVSYWDDVFKKIEFYRSNGLDFLIEKIPPWHFDKYNINKLLDVTYQRILLSLSHRADLKKTRIVFDDYGIGYSLNRYLNALSNAGAEIIKATKADDKYLESKIASLISKREQQKVLEAVSHNPDFQIAGEDLGSGNAGDKKTIGWLKAWHNLGKEWPWFVKQSFKTIRDIEGIRGEPQKIIPPINEHLLSKEFKEKFESGELNIQTLSVVCPCGEIAKALKLIYKEGKFIPVCVSCNKELIGASLTLRYYCGRIMPDNSVVSGGLISKDLDSSKFFEGFTLLIHPTLRHESDTKGGKKELERLGHFAAIGRIRLEETGSILNPKELNNIERDESMILGTIENKAILLTGDNQMKGIAQAKNIFVIEV